MKQAEVYAKNNQYQLTNNEELLRNVNYCEAKTVLDIGCGTGETTLQIAKNMKNGKVIGIDISKDMLGYAQKYNSADNIEYIHSDAETFKLPYKFDVIFSFNSFHWVKNKLEAFANISNHLNSNGMFHIVTNAGIPYLFKTYEKTALLKEFTKYNLLNNSNSSFPTFDEYETLARKSHFKMVNCWTKLLNRRFANYEEHFNYFKGFHPIFNKIPPKEAHDFMNKYIKESYNYNAPKNDGSLEFKVIGMYMSFSN